MNHFEDELEARLKEFERSAAAFWSPKKEDIPLPEKAVIENWDDRKIRQVCTRKTSAGNDVFMLGEYRQMLVEMDRVRRLRK